MEDQLNMYWFTASDEVHVEEVQQFFSQVNAQPNNMSLLQNARMEVLEPLIDAGSANFEVGGVGRDE